MLRRAAARVPLGAQAVRLTLALAFLSLADCTSPRAVARFATSASAVTARMPDAAATLSAACHRSQSYRLRRTSSAWFEADSLRAACAGRDSALRDVARVNRVLSSYFSALGALAGQKVAGFAEPVGSLADASGSAGHLDRREVEAVAGLATFAAEHATDGYRRGRLRSAIVTENANVQAVTSALHDILERDFAHYLDDDAAAQSGFYRSALTESAAREPLTALLVRDSYDQRQAELLERAAAVRALSRALLVIGRGHQALYDARDHLGRKELLASVLSTARELDAAIAKIDKAF